MILPHHYINPMKNLILVIVLIAIAACLPEEDSVMAPVTSLATSGHNRRKNIFRLFGYSCILQKNSLCICGSPPIPRNRSPNNLVQRRAWLLQLNRHASINRAIHCGQ